MSELTAQGFERTRLPQIREELRASFRDAFGPIDTSPSGRFGQIIGILAEREDRVLQLAEAVYLSQYPSSASGRSLSEVVTYNGITRLAATRSFGDVVLIGDPGTAIPTGSQISNTETGAVYETTTQVTLSESESIQALVDVTTVTDSTAYTITLDNVDYTYTSGTGATATTIAEGLVALIDAESEYDATNDGGEIQVIAVDRSTDFSLSAGTGLTVTEAGTPARVRAIEPGRKLAPAGTLVDIETPVSGWTGVEQYLDVTPGRDRESDPELRLRRERSLRIAGGGTVEGIRARLLNDVADVTAVSIIENRSDEEDSAGRPPHSYEAVVTGGTDEAVANEIWQSKPAGIETIGDVTVTVLDSQGNNQAISFSRPIGVYIWVRMDVTVNGVGTWPEDGPDAIRTELVEYGEALGTGDDVIYQALFGPIYSVPGIESVSLEIARTSAPDVTPDSGDWVTENITIANAEQSLWGSDRIEVSVV